MVDSMKPLEVRPVGVAEQKAARKLLTKFSDQDLTLADAVGLHLMQTSRVHSCWSTDFHLGLTGVPLVIHER
jgi:predicted nucleic acid-binding protein